MPACLDRQEWPPFICGSPPSFEGKTIIVIITAEALQLNMFIRVSVTFSSCLSKTTPPPYVSVYPLLAKIASKNYSTTSGNTASPPYLPSLWGVGERKRYMATSPCGGLDRINHLVGHLLHMVYVASYRTMKSRGFLDAIMRLTVW